MNCIDVFSECGSSQNRCLAVDSYLYFAFFYDMTAAPFKSIWWMLRSSCSFLSLSIFETALGGSYGPTESMQKLSLFLLALPNIIFFRILIVT